jgi:sugar phosphate isomerase/epimerase
VRQLSLTSPDAAVRRRACDFINAIIDLAGSFGAPAILGSMQGRFEGGVSREQALIWLAEALEQLGPRAHAHGVPLLYEHLNRYESNLINRVSDAVTFLKSLRTTNVKLLADLFHMNIEEASPAGAVRDGGAWIGHVHYADSNRLAMGMGHTQAGPIVEALQSIGYTGYLSAEIFPLPDPESAARQTLDSIRRSC